MPRRLHPPVHLPAHALGALLGALALAAVGQGVPGAEASEGPQPLVENLTGFDDQTVTIPAHVPVPAGATGIGPGSRLLINIPGPGGGNFGCTANFVWTDGAQQYLGSAGHCFLPDGATSTHGPDSDFNPAGVSVRVCVANCLAGGLLGGVIQGTYVNLGSVVYARQHVGGVGIGNDFGLAEIPAALAAQVRPSMPVWGGPTGVVGAQQSALKPVCHYGNGRYVGELFVTKARAGVSFGGDFKQWTARILINGGDSGSAIEACTTDEAGVHGAGALGLITHGAVEPVLAMVPLGQGFGTTVARAIQMASQDAGLSISLVNGV